MAIYASPIPNGRTELQYSQISPAQTGIRKNKNKVKASVKASKNLLLTINKKQQESSYLINNEIYNNLIQSCNIKSITIGDKEMSSASESSYSDIESTSSRSSFISENMSTFPSTRKSRGFHFTCKNNLVDEAIDNLDWELISYQIRMKLNESLPKKYIEEEESGKINDNLVRNIIQILKQQEIDHKNNKKKKGKLESRKERASALTLEKLSGISITELKKKEDENSKTNDSLEEKITIQEKPTKKSFRQLKKGDESPTEELEEELEFMKEQYKLLKQMRETKEKIKKRKKEKEKQLNQGNNFLKMQQLTKENMSEEEKEENDFGFNEGFMDDNYEQFPISEHLNFSTMKMNSLFTVPSMIETGEEFNNIISKIFAGNLTNLLKNNKEEHYLHLNDNELALSNKEKVFKCKDTSISIKTKKISKDVEDFKAEVITSLELKKYNVKADIVREVDEAGKVAKITLNISQENFIKSTTYVYLDGEKEKRFYKIKKSGGIEIVIENNGKYIPCKNVETDIEIIVKDGEKVLCNYKKENTKEFDRIVIEEEEEPDFNMGGNEEKEELNFNMGGNEEKPTIGNFTKQLKKENNNKSKEPTLSLQ